MTKVDFLTAIENGEHDDPLFDEVRVALSKYPKTIVILDDDPTGTQTVYGIPVITSWTEDVLEKELLNSQVFFILTNSRSLQENEAKALSKEIGHRLQFLAKKHKKHLIVISRGDSTLRGHFPAEVDALATGLGWPRAKQLIAPAFFEGGRYTINDIHYVKEGEKFVPASETPFAQDNTFGYTSSNLKKWIVEKSGGSINEEAITSIPISATGFADSMAIEQALSAKASHIVVNALTYQNLVKVALGCLKHDSPLLYRTAASFVNAITGIAPRPCLAAETIVPKGIATGGLIVVGSYVPKTTSQLKYIQGKASAEFIELKVGDILDQDSPEDMSTTISKRIDKLLQAGSDVVLHTSRTVVKGKNERESLHIVNRVSAAVIDIVKQLEVRPKYILAKGGITSSDIATKALRVQKATILGQVLKGVPVWELGDESKFPDVPYIVFPGNVGDDKALYTILKQFE